VHDVSVALMNSAYGQAPVKMYFMGSSEGGPRLRIQVNGDLRTERKLNL
jgi:hypothetical protein